MCFIVGKGVKEGLEMGEVSVEWILVLVLAIAYNPESNSTPSHVVPSRATPVNSAKKGMMAQFKNSSAATSNSHFVFHFLLFDYNNKCNDIIYN
ncbi:uncharacterized protein LOC126669505 isoform X2 [Mercurialis annua]|uniref:uncharacterized protein LOC126669505 isoform X2 n=1 Tax=Mercurialis annua TaxID=3986 RepID=UPI00215F1D6E|nr:uncharacterized protein LOC126669505 isoform X2 [Mercurialis annua]